MALTPLKHPHPATSGRRRSAASARDFSLTRNGDRPAPSRGPNGPRASTRWAGTRHAPRCRRPRYWPVGTGQRNSVVAHWWRRATHAFAALRATQIRRKPPGAAAAGGGAAFAGGMRCVLLRLNARAVERKGREQRDGVCGPCCDRANGCRREAVATGVGSASGAASLVASAASGAGDAAGSAGARILAHPEKSAALDRRL